uniref:CCHC-type domain-containing protein n=1 Tax=Cannabis sativa TaxID=3483 RepID=A0A803PCR3_CANSA
MLYIKCNDLSIENSLTSTVDLTKKEDGIPDIPATVNEPDPSERRQVPSGPTKLKFEGRRIGAGNLPQDDKFIPTCHFCNRKGHIRPKCYKLQNYLKAMINRPNSFPQPNKPQGREPRRERKINLT